MGWLLIVLIFAVCIVGGFFLFPPYGAIIGLILALVVTAKLNSR